MSDETTTQETPKDLRDRLDRAEAALAEAETTASTATSELRQYKAAVTFEKHGLTAKHADLFLKANPEAEVTAEAVQTFADEYGLVSGEAPQPVAPKEDPNKGLAPLGQAAGAGAAGSAPAAQPKMSAEDFEKLLEENPQEAAKAYVEGRTNRNEHNVTAKELVAKGIIDH